MSDQSLPFDNRTPRHSADQANARGSSAHPHSYPLLVRDHGLMTSWGLLMRSLPYVMARMGVLLFFATLSAIWLLVAFGGAAWIGTAISTTFGIVWLVPWLIAGGWIWGTIARYSLHLIACGHVAVLTQLITFGTAGPAGESQFSYGRRVVVERFGQVTALFAFSALVKGVLETFHRTLDSFGEMLSIPGISSITSILDAIAKAATRYIDKVILSYTLARNDGEPWRDAQDGIVYYCQNATAILKTSVWMVVVEKLISFLLFGVAFAVAAFFVVLMPESVREWGAAVTLCLAFIFTAIIRSAFLKPLFLVSMLVRFHALVENQQLNTQWSDYLDRLTPDFARGGR